MIEITVRQHIHILEMELFKYYPNKYIRKYLMNTNDIVDHKYGSSPFTVKWKK
jgi:hypothetical protein